MKRAFLIRREIIRNIIEEDKMIADYLTTLDKHQIYGIRDPRKDLWRGECVHCGTNKEGDGSSAPAMDAAAGTISGVWIRKQERGL